MICPACGSEVPEGTKFCEKCGMPIKEAFEADGKGQAMPYTSANTGNKEKIQKAIEGLGLNKLQKTVAVLSAFATLCFLISLKGTLGTWIPVLASLLLSYLVMKKYDCKSKAMAVAFSILATRVLLEDISAAISDSFHYGFFAILLHILPYAIVLLYWLLVIGKIKKKSGTALLFAGVVVFGLYGLLFASGRSLFKLGWLGFSAVYAIMIWKDGETVSYIKSCFFAKEKAGINAYSKIYAQYCPNCGCGQDADAVFCEKCGVRLEKKEEVADREPLDAAQELTCPKCGRNLETDSLFCDCCGAELTAFAMKEKKTETEKKEPSCDHCGTVLEEGSKFCSICGAKVE